ncbi:MAG: sugar phosphate nucleotidyltransferase [Gaiellales bacterium]
MRNDKNPTSSEAQAVILAGGLGRRLAPYTSVLPKPLMPVGDRAVLEIVVGQLASHGFNDIIFSVGYLSHLIRAIFDSRSDRTIEIRYVQEETPLGTAAPVRLIEGLDDTFILMNGDVLTTLDYRELLRRHREDGNVITVATIKRTVKIDYGVVHTQDGLGRVESWEEKPEIASLVSMGVYAVERSAIEFIPKGKHFDFPDLVQALLRAGQPVGCYLHDGIWFDIGRRDDYEQAVASWTAYGNGHSHASPDGVMLEVP